MNTSVLSILEKIQSELDDNTEFWNSINSWGKFEERIAERVKDISKDQHSHTIKHVDYQKGSNAFPDIVVHGHKDEKIGIEVKLKTAKSAGWKTIGGSVYETTKRNEFESVHLIFGHKVLEKVKHTDYYKSIVDIKVTHSPRYYLDIDNMSETFFDTLGVDSGGADEIIEAFKKRTLESLEDGQSLWWIDNHNSVERDQFLISALKPWETLSKDEQNNVLAKIMVLFPEIFDVQGPNKYGRLTKFLMMREGIYSHCLRDKFSAGGKKVFVLPTGEKVKIPAFYIRLFENAKHVSTYLKMDGLDEFEKQARYEDIIECWEVHNIDKSQINIENLEDEWLSVAAKLAGKTFERENLHITIEQIYKTGLDS
ncbi:hypothetical protein SAMN02745945_02953 [Peptoclostridium litorale DSM 5388]|uniref:Uncharacterized protein n=1 Tax=Peptoclostridium litorale DSM 5388 TaxID=1121324 RepID=A0A069RRK7_PEPLI|nr:hypothetical protein [Peptoclostridium litorale]KDR96812.1 hypothetical protein CLIT_20p00250 [Peptoclostridium litorale DSM 5388]SIO36451.1 hypothetical protein SAMN02745945_02953 [Peptoclostridium litorale DSM 5388]